MPVTAPPEANAGVADPLAWPDAGLLNSSPDCFRFTPAPNSFSACSAPGPSPMRHDLELQSSLFRRCSIRSSIGLVSVRARGGTPSAPNAPNECARAFEPDVDVELGLTPLPSLGDVGKSSARRARLEAAPKDGERLYPAP